MKIIVTETDEEYKVISEEAKAQTILVLIKVPDSDMYYVKKGRYKFKLPRYISKSEIAELMLIGGLG